MKKQLFFLSVSVLFVLSLPAQNVGIGISSPLEKLHIDSGHLKIGLNPWGSSLQDRFIKIGDGDFIRIGETGEDDRLEFSARNFIFRPSAGGYSGNVGIGTSGAPAAKLEVNGNFMLTDGTQGQDKILVSNASGVAAWKAVSINTGFRATNLSAQSIPSSISTMVVFDDLSYNDGIFFSGSTYTASEIGLYHFDVMVTWGISSSIFNASYVLNIVKSGTIQNSYRLFIPSGTTGNFSEFFSCDMRLGLGNAVKVEVTQNSGIAQGINTGTGTYFSGHRVY